LRTQFIILDGRWNKFVTERYAGWQQPWAQAALNGTATLDTMADHAYHRDIDELPVSGRQEYLENLINQFC
jgi:xylose isomerase